MTDYLGEKKPRSRGRVRCYHCGRRIPKGEQYTRYTFADGRDIWDIPACDPCEDAVPLVRCWIDDFDWDDYGPGIMHEWACEAMDGCYHTPYGLFDDDYFPEAWEARLRALVEEAEEAAAADVDPTRAWGDEAWAAFTWRTQTSSVINPTKRAEK